MAIIDIVILLFVIIVLSLIVYFRFIRKGSRGLKCNCYKAKNCHIKLDALRKTFENGQKKA